MLTSISQTIDYARLIIKIGIIMAKIVLLGAGTGGIPAAYETKEILANDYVLKAFGIERLG